MASISAYDSSSISTLFSSLSSSKQSSGTSANFGIDLSNYGLIKSGSYYKMMRAYYSTDSEGNSIASTSTSTSTSKDTAKTLTNIKSSASSLKDTAKALYTTGTDSVFNKKTVKDADGNSTTDYDTDAIYKAVNSFVSDYNSLVTAAGKSNTSSIANTTAAMVNTTSNNAGMLSKIGISVNSKDYTLSIDEDAFKKADMSTVKSLFNGSGSYAYSVAVKASMVNSYADIESSKSNTYSGSGNFTYNYSTGQLYNTTT
jgi:hypothetical protein